MKLSTDSIKARFNDFFATKEARDALAIYWESGGAGETSVHDLTDAARDLKVTVRSATGKDIADATMAAYRNPASWKRVSKYRLEKLDEYDNPLETGNVEDFENCCGELARSRT